MKKVFNLKLKDYRSRGLASKATISKAIVLFALSAPFLEIAHANDTARSETVRSELGRSSSKENQARPSRIQCPPLLEEWVGDDFTDKTSWGFSYKSEAKTCQSQVQAYKDFFTQKNKNIKFSYPQNLSDYFSKKFGKQINPAYKGSLDKCNKLSSETAFTTQTRFYSAGTKLEAANSSILDELAHIDSVLPDMSVLNGVECPFIWPEIKTKCEASKTASRECSSSKQQQFDNIVRKTQETIPLIEALITAQHNCINKFTREPGAPSGRGLSKSTQQKVKNSCDPIAAAIEIKKNEIPWVRGSDFQKAAIIKKPRPRNGVFATEYDLSEATVAKGIAEQLKHNRKALADTYNSNLEDFRCLSNSPATGQTCEFEKIRTHLQHLPDLRDKTVFSANSSDREAKIYFDAESCLLERHEDRAQTKKVVDGAMSGIALTVATFGLGEAIAGIQVVNSTSKLAQLRQGLLAVNTGLNATFVGVTLKHSYESCSAETKAVIGVAKQADMTKENVCSSPSSGLSQAKDRESNCILTALLSAPSVLPFVGAIPSLRNLANKSGPSNSVDGSANSIAETSTKVVDTAVKTEKTLPASVPVASKETAASSAVAPKTASASSAKGTNGVPEYLTVGSKDAESAVKIAETLRARNIDPRSTNIPEFATKVDSHVDFARKSIQAQATSDTPERLKILNDFAAEAAARVKDGKVTYEWWHDYNYRLSILMTPAASRTAVAGGYEDKFAKALLDSDGWKTEAGFRAVAAQQKKSAFSMYEAGDVAKAYPNQVVIPSTEGDLGIAALNSTYGSDTSIIGMIGSKIRADGREMHPDHFFRHDHVHVGNDAFVNSRYEIPKEMRAQLRTNYMQYRDTVPPVGDRRNAFEFSYFIVTHELPGVDSITREGGNYSRLVAPDMVKLVRDPDWYAGAVPAWARESDANAKRFLEMSLQELKTFSGKHYPK